MQLNSIYGIMDYNENERNKMNDKKEFIYEIIKITRGLDVHPYHTFEVVGADSIELDVFGYSNPTEVFTKWATKAQREYGKVHKTDARDSYVFRYPIIEQQREEEE